MALGAGIETIPYVRDPFGYFNARNRRLLEAMVRMPKVAQMTRAILEGIDMWCEERGLPRENVDFEARLTRQGTIVITLREGDPSVSNDGD